MEKAYQLTEFSDLSKDYGEYERFYVGDQHCEHNAIAILSNPEIQDFVRRSGKYVTVVTPQVSDLRFEAFAHLVHDYLQTAPRPEVVINDFGMLRAFSGGPFEVVFWNVLVGQSKDPMIREFSARETHARIGIDLPFYQNMFRKAGISKAEVFNTFQGWMTTNLKDVAFHLNFPYVPYSQTRYCRVSLESQKKDCLEVVTDCRGCHSHGAKKLELDLAKRSELWPIRSTYVGNRQMYRNDSEPKDGFSRIVLNYDLALG